mgnify:CR=1 FL=1
MRDSTLPDDDGDASLMVSMLSRQSNVRVATCLGLLWPPRLLGRRRNDQEKLTLLSPCKIIFLAFKTQTSLVVSGGRRASSSSTCRGVSEENAASARGDLDGPRPPLPRRAL